MQLLVTFYFACICFMWCSSLLQRLIFSCQLCLLWRNIVCIIYFFFIYMGFKLMLISPVSTQQDQKNISAVSAVSNLVYNVYFAFIFLCCDWHHSYTCLLPYSCVSHVGIYQCLYLAFTLDDSRRLLLRLLKLMLQYLTFFCSFL